MPFEPDAFELGGDDIRHVVGWLPTPKSAMKTLLLLPIQTKQTNAR